MHARIVLGLMIICCGKQKPYQAHNQKNAPQHQSLENTSINFSRKQGFITLKRTYNPAAVITLYNVDGSIWKTIKLNDTYNDTAINPTAIKPENRLLVFKCLGTEKEFYKVIADESANLAKYIKQSDPNFMYETTQAHILTVFSVEFNEHNNPLRLFPTEQAKAVQINKNSFYYPIEIQDNWLKVEDDEGQQFWIKWSDKRGNLILNLYYDA